jgi:very-short-patch-repair endonuclease
MRTGSHYNKNLKLLARQLRNDSTLGEVILWSKLLSKSRLGFQFNRQYPIDNYIADFISRKLKLIIEVDGYSHKFKEDSDAVRDSKLNALGFDVLRIQEKDVKFDFDNVCRIIVLKIEEQKKKYGL